jgi:hypothetical protein
MGRAALTERAGRITGRIAGPNALRYQAASTISVRRTPTALPTSFRRSATTSLSGPRAARPTSRRTASDSIRSRAPSRIYGTPPESR